MMQRSHEFQMKRTSDDERRTAVTTVAEYRGETSVAVSATQLGTRYTRTDTTRILSEWCDFFVEPTPIMHAPARSNAHFYRDYVRTKMPMRQLG